jgi:two-component system, LytTR family, sensor kinase
MGALMRNLNIVRRLTLAYAIALAVWLSIGGLGVIQLQVNHRSRAFDLPRAEATILFFLAVAILTPPVFYLGRKFPITRKTAIHPAFIYLAGAPLFSILFACVRWTIAPPWNDELHRFAARTLSDFWPATYASFSTLLWIYLEILLTANALEYFERARSEALERAEVEQALAASELQLLKAQLHPHFLFNTLHGIATLANEDGPKASEMVLQLANLLRAALEHSTSDLVPLRDELRFISAYLDLEKMRFGSRLVVHWLIQPEVQGALVPHLILQPLVENAVMHGVGQQRTGGFVELAANAEGGNLVITVNNSLGISASPGTGLGLKNTKGRLRYLYGPGAELDFKLDESTHIATATLRIPLLAVAPIETEPVRQEA